MKAYIKPVVVVIDVAAEPVMATSYITIDPSKGTNDNFVREEEEVGRWHSSADEMW